ncbi:hypothetical protein AB3662_31455 [Sorangium cellulosum]|uniref:hypothetical protein n=1 Tax=Sorangium cellulosum TaxID=56 RepID=UPI003D9A3446
MSVMRMVPVPPRPDSCELEFLQLPMEQLSPTGAYEMIGNVALSETGVQDPFQERYREIVRPHACQMGGEGVTILMQATNSTATGSGSSVVYTVVRKRQAPGAPAAPQKF